MVAQSQQAAFFGGEEEHQTHHHGERRFVDLLGSNACQEASAAIAIIALQRGDEHRDGMVNLASELDGHLLLTFAAGLEQALWRFLIGHTVEPLQRQQ